ncbi:uncharacterized protein F5891DRAFT_980330 [Suillus fuscotomentosus]|uniref:Uncharacterized protein n=1 Tax=Suillus fuscotomentosus TaxID=1912939 RepID=A0AAD4HKW5_9AGAM|nr:uncharacterized protein F5891DRAFT_980330 [Suillus fuscotomentosus]KAG1900373.1 hypothetical protein F5891DRAFT_980330 [Suillus fuscotomentosus]
MFEDDLDIDQEFETSQPAAKYDCPPSRASPTLGDNEYFDRKADADIIMGMDEDPVDRDFYVDEDVPSDDESLDNQSEDIEGGDEHVWDPEVDPEYLSNDAVLEDGLAQEDQSELEDILPHALSEHLSLLNGYLTVLRGNTYPYSYNNELNKDICTLIRSTAVRQYKYNSTYAEFETTFALDVIQVVTHHSQLDDRVSVLTLIRATAMLTLQVVAHRSQDDEVSVSTLIRATAMLTLQVVAHRSQEEAHMGAGKGAGASEVSDTLGFTRIDP